MDLNDTRINAYKKTANSLNDEEKKSGRVQAYTFQSFEKPDPSTEPTEPTEPIKLTAQDSKSPEHLNSPDENVPSQSSLHEGDRAFTQKIPTQIEQRMAREGLLKLTKNPQKESEKPAFDSVYRRVAKFLLLIGVNEAARILPHLAPEQTERIIPEIASIRSVDPDEATVILAEFQSLLERSRQAGGVNTARAILEKAFGSQRAQEMLDKSVLYPEGTPFEYLQEMDGDRLFFLLKDEGIPVQALVLSRIKPIAAADFITRLDGEEQKEILLRLAKLTGMSPEVIRRVDRAMYEKVQSIKTGSTDTIDGRSALAEILKKMNIGAEKDILSTLTDTDPELGRDIRERLFTIDDIIGADDRFIQEKLRVMTEKDIAYLIAAKPKNFRDKILLNVSQGRGDLILEEEQMAKPMRKRDIDDITNIFFSALRRAWEEGKFIIKGRDEDIYV